MPNLPNTKPKLPRPIQSPTPQIARRFRIDKFTSAEKAIFNAVHEVEAAGAHPLLTDAVILLAQAREKVADFVDRQI